MSGAFSNRLPDGRMHLHHGPIDLICEAWGPPDLIEAGYLQVWRRFDGLLEELVAELPALRHENMALFGKIAQAMGRAVVPFRPAFITPMAAVAGAVAEEVLAALVRPWITRAYVNNGGDIALHLAAGAQFDCALADSGNQITVRFEDSARGIATSGWRGRSWSLGIADSVSVLAKSASVADAAATMIANAVDLPGHPGIARRPAHEMQADSDLGARLVTVGVGRLSRSDIDKALARGVAAAQAYRANGLIESAALFLQGESQIVGPLALKEAALV